MVVLFHGLEGSSGSHYSVALLTALAQRGWRGVVPHFRSCGGTPNRQPRVYHSGDHEEIGSMLAAVRARVTPATPVFAVGVSLGGSALLNWLGRAGTSAAAHADGGGGSVGAAGPDGGRRRHRPGPESPLHLALPADAQAEEPRSCAPVSRPARPGAGAHRPDHVGVRRRRDRAAARLHRHRRLLDAGVVEAVARRHRHPDAGAQRDERPVRSRGVAGVAARRRSRPSRCSTRRRAGTSGSSSRRRPAGSTGCRGGCCGSSPGTAEASAAVRRPRRTCRTWRMRRPCRPCGAAGAPGPVR